MDQSDSQRRSSNRSPSSSSSNSSISYDKEEERRLILKIQAKNRSRLEQVNLPPSAQSREIDKAKEELNSSIPHSLQTGIHQSLQPASLNQGNQSRTQRIQRNQRARNRCVSRSRSRSRDRGKERSRKWHVYTNCEQIKVTQDRFPKTIMHLPIFEKKNELIQKIKNNQFVLVTGETGCGKSTQVPRLLYEYLRISGESGSIMCVQPRRLAVLNLHHILQEQMAEKGHVGYQIAMQTNIKLTTKILFMTNGIFLQRLVHSTDELFEQFPFIVLDQVHERDIDTDFILLAIKRIARNHPKLRVVLMSATIDNELFRYYFAQDHIDSFLEEENFYRKIMRRAEEKQRQAFDSDDEDNYKSDDQEKLYKQMQFEFLQARHPCPSVSITETGKFKKEVFYLDTLEKFLNREFNMKWGSILFSEKYPNTHRELFEIVINVIEEVIWRASSNDKSYSSVLIFLPGLLEIQTLGDCIKSTFGRQKVGKLLQILSVHSSILTEDLTRRLHTLNKEKIKIILATNIAESSITVMGVKYVIDFCLSKEVHFDQKSRMENLELIWASQASCKQRAGRTGRVCDGFVVRLVEKKFFEKLPEYSTPQIQRSSLDRLILRIKMIHENQKSKIFAEPGDVLGTAIQPPRLKHIDEAIKSLLFCGGLKLEQDQLILTPLGRLYIDLPIDICYSKMLVMSILFGTFNDILILVSLLSQNKNPFRKAVVERSYMDYYELFSNNQRCDFWALINIYKQKQRLLSKNKNYGNDKYSRQKDRGSGRDRREDEPNDPYHQRNIVLDLDIYKEAQLLKEDLLRRIKKKKIIEDYQNESSASDYNERFKFTIIAGFLNKIISVRQPIYDDKQQKRATRMRSMGIQINNTLTLMNSQVIRKKSSDSAHADQKLIDLWKNHIHKNIHIDMSSFGMTVTEGLSYLHFNRECDLNKLLFVKFMEDNRKTTQNPDDKGVQIGNYVSVPVLLRVLGDLDHMQAGTMFTLIKDQRIAVDNFSQNRIVSVNTGQRRRFLMTNTVMQQSSRLFCRYTSLLPDINNIEVISHLIFYPFITLVTDRKNKRYEEIYLKKRMRLRVQYELVKSEIAEMNQLRCILRNFLSHDFGYRQETETNQQNRHEDRRDYNPQRELPQDSSLPHFGNSNYQMQPQKMNQSARQDQPNQGKLERKAFWPLLKQFIYRPRLTMFDESKWQIPFFKQCKIESGECLQPQERRMPRKQKVQAEQQRQFMNQVIPKKLSTSYFSSQQISESEYRERINLFNQWKLKKLEEIEALKEKALNKSPFLCCGQCQVPIAPLQNVGSVQNIYYRDVYRQLSNNVKQLPFNQMGDYFCAMLMSLVIQKQYKIYGCPNEHYFGIKFEGERHLKITKFSQLKIIYPDEHVEQAYFDNLDQAKWFKENEKAKRRKQDVQISAVCFVCDMKFTSFRELEKHFKDAYHDQNMKDFKKGTQTEYNFKQQQGGY